MENQGTNVKRGRGSAKKSTGSTRRVWTSREEHVLIGALKDLVNNGWKSDNGFRTGYLNKLEDALKVVFPQTDLVANPNINSKLTTWKKTYGSLVSAQRDTTGVGFNMTTNTLEVTDEQWELVVQRDPNMRGMRHKEWPFFQDWIEIFGKDRATGEIAEDVVDGARIMRTQYNLPPKRVRSEFNYDNVNFVNLDDPNDPCPEGSPKTPVNEGHAENSIPAPTMENTTTTATGKKRKSKAQSSDPSMVQLLTDFIQTTGERLDTIAHRIGYDYDLGEKRSKVFSLLDKIEGLSTVQKLDASQLIMAKVECLHLFMELSDDARHIYALRLLAKEANGMGN